MNSFFCHFVCVVALLVLTSSQAVRAQVDSAASEETTSVLQNTLPPADEKPELADEDVPPPAPTPETATTSPTPTRPTPTVTARPVRQGPEARAYGFGVSYVPTDQGLQVVGVVVGSIAAQAGVRPNDMIIALNGDAPSADVLVREPVESLEVIRGGVHRALTVADPGVATTAPQQRQTYSAPSNPAPTPPNPPTNTYRAPADYRPGYQSRSYSYRSYYGRPRVSVGYGVGPAYGVGPGYGVYRGYGPGIGYYGYGGYGRGVGVRYGTGGYGRSGFSIRIGF